MDSYMPFQLVKQNLSTKRKKNGNYSVNYGGPVDISFNYANVVGMPNDLQSHLNAQLHSTPFGIPASALTSNRRDDLLLCNNNMACGDIGTSYVTKSSLKKMGIYLNNPTPGPTTQQFFVGQSLMTPNVFPREPRFPQ
jgi:hypothetical protein